MGKAKKRARLFRRLGPPGESPVVKRLRLMASKVTTLAQFERMVLTSDHPQEFRALVAPMLAPHLPCCTRRWNEPHQKGCPQRAESQTPSLIITPEQEAMRQAGMSGAVAADAPVGLVDANGRPLR